jgi:predicted nucleic acid-binding protein
MSARSFFDTNVLVYTDDKTSATKRRSALALVPEHRRSGSGVVSIQVLQEYFVAVTRKLNLDVRIARRKVELLAEFDVFSPDVGDILAASIFSGSTISRSGTRSSFALPSRPAVRCFSRNICKQLGNSTAFGL